MSRNPEDIIDVAMEDMIEDQETSPRLHQIMSGIFRKD
jgi:hypothetical protein